MPLIDSYTHYNSLLCKKHEYFFCWCVNIKRNLFFASLSGIRCKVLLQDSAKSFAAKNYQTDIQNGTTPSLVLYYTINYFGVSFKRFKSDTLAQFLHFIYPRHSASFNCSLGVILRQIVPYQSIPSPRDPCTPMPSGKSILDC